MSAGFKDKIKKICFILSPIGPKGSSVRRESDNKFNFVYEPVCVELGYKAIRADQERTSNLITTDIIDGIVNAEMVIADLSGDNPNVFYELAVRNAVNKPVILVKRVGQDLPFDITNKRAISIDIHDISQLAKANEELKDVLKSAEEDPARASESILSNFSFDIISGKQKGLTYVRTIIGCLKDIWKKTTIILLNLDLHKLPENAETIPLGLGDVVQTYKMQILLSLDQLNNLAVLSSPVLDSTMVMSLLDLKQQLHDNVIQTGLVRAIHPWSAGIQRIDQFVKQFFPAHIEEFGIRELKKLLPTDIRDSIMEGRNNN